MPEFKSSVLINERVKTLHELVTVDKRTARQIRAAVDTEYRKQQRRLFSTEGASGGERWAPLSQEYQRRKTKALGVAPSKPREKRKKSRAKRKKSQVKRNTAKSGEAAKKKTRARRTRPRVANKILQFSGKLRKSFTDAGAADHIAKAFKRGKSWIIRVGSRNVLGAYHGPGRLHNPRLPVRDPNQRTDTQALRMHRQVGRVVGAKMQRAVRAIAQSKKFFRVA